MLTSRQRAFLRSLAHPLDPVFQVGKGGLDDNLIRELGDVLEARELIKVNVLKNCPDDLDTVADGAGKALGADVVQKIGRKFVLYRPNSEEPTIELP